jgi:isopenicillin N synthase-like dioxygenase
MEIPTLDLARWSAASSDERAQIAETLDTGLRQIGLIQLLGHGVPIGMRAELRAASRSFFKLPRATKARYRIEGHGNGWRGSINTSALYGLEKPADLQESFLIGAEHRTGDPEYDRIHYPANRWPDEVAELRNAAQQCAAALTHAAERVLGVFADILGLSGAFFTAATDRATWTLSMNWYPSLHAIGSLQDGQLRVSPHTDFGTVTLLDRQLGVGGLQVWQESTGWFRPPYDPDALLVNLGDLMHLWTDGRWNAPLHRVLPPSEKAPDEELLSLAFFIEANPDAVVKPLAPPTGGGQGLGPVVAGDWIREKLGILNA